jgi:hypothetical protein
MKLKIKKQEVRYSLISLNFLWFTLFGIVSGLNYKQKRWKDE